MVVEIDMKPKGLAFAGVRIDDERTDGTGVQRADKGINPLEAGERGEQGWSLMTSLGEGMSSVGNHDCFTCATCDGGGVERAGRRVIFSCHRERTGDEKSDRRCSFLPQRMT